MTRKWRPYVKTPKGPVKAAGIMDTNPIPLTELDDLILGNKTPEQVVEEAPSNQRIAEAFNESGVFKPFRVIPGGK